ncbi:MAG: hypothetical protein GXO85_02545 [Chlorobi bacterium]|nr:hypothetical protein [Chlorobiota bacterium]
MKSRIMVSHLFLGIILINLFLLSSCDNSTELIEEQRLIIENGYFNKVESINSDENNYAIEFTYYVKGEECNWGGYSIQMDSIGRSLNLYSMQTLKPDEKHMIVDTIKMDFELQSNPIVKMQGYKIGSSKSYKKLYTEYILEPKF